MDRFLKWLGIIGMPLLLIFWVLGFFEHPSELIVVGKIFLLATIGMVVYFLGMFIYLFLKKKNRERMKNG